MSAARKFDPRELPPSWPMWVLARTPRPDNPPDVIRSIRRMVVGTDEWDGTIVPVFTDDDLADRYHASLDDTDEYSPLPLNDHAELCVVILGLKELGETHVIFDPNPSIPGDLIPPRFFPIVEVIRGFAEHPC